jgi:hypothetical protein
MFAPGSQTCSIVDECGRALSQSVDLSSTVDNPLKSWKSGGVHENYRNHLKYCNLYMKPMIPSMLRVV